MSQLVGSVSVCVCVHIHKYLHVHMGKHTYNIHTHTQSEEWAKGRQPVARHTDRGETEHHI